MSLPNAYFCLESVCASSGCYLLLFNITKANYNIISALNSRSFFNLDNENGVEDTPRLIDRKVSLRSLTSFLVCTVYF